MEVDIDYLIDTCEKWIAELEGSGEVHKGVMLLCAKELFEREKEREGVQMVGPMEDVAMAAESFDCSGLIHADRVKHIVTDLARRFKSAFADFMQSKRSFYCTNTECPLKKTLAEAAGKENA